MAENNNSGATEPKYASYPENLLHPRDYVGPKIHGSEQSQGTTDVIIKLSPEQDFNNAAQGKGIAGPAEWGGPSDKKEGKSSAEAGSKQSNEYNVDLVSGQNNCWNGGRRK